MQKNKLLVLEDCALSLGAKFDKKHTGLTVMQVYSHFTLQNILQLVRRNINYKKYENFKKIKLLKSLGINKSFLKRKTPGIYDATDVGFNYRMSELHASISGTNWQNKHIFKKRKTNFEFLKKFQDCKDMYILDSTSKNQKIVTTA